MANDLFIDRAVRDWVFVPLTIFIILMKLIMQYVHVVRFFLFSSSPRPSVSRSFVVAVVVAVAP